VVHSLTSARCYSVKITQIPLKLISKADRVKKLNFENKYMFGAKMKDKERKKESTIKRETVAQLKSDKDLSSEIYWTCLHVPEVQDFTKVKKKKSTKLKVPRESKSYMKGITDRKILPLLEQKNEEPPKSFKEKHSKVIVKKPELPETLTLLQSTFPETKSKISETMNSSFTLQRIQMQRAKDDQEIPFESHQLRAIANFPLSMGKNKIIREFEDLLANPPTMYLPSVSKVLQATMPEMQRQALLRWKNLKISELGLDGFEKMQQCKSSLDVQ
jgi:hypothetical protein